MTDSIKPLQQIIQNSLGTFNAPVAAPDSDIYSSPEKRPDDADATAYATAQGLKQYLANNPLSAYVSPAIKQRIAQAVVQPDVPDSPLQQYRPKPEPEPVHMPSALINAAGRMTPRITAQQNLQDQLTNADQDPNTFATLAQINNVANQAASPAEPEKATELEAYGLRTPQDMDAKTIAKGILTGTLVGAAPLSTLDAALAGEGAPLYAALQDAQQNIEQEKQNAKAEEVSLQSDATLYNRLKNNEDRNNYAVSDQYDTEAYKRYASSISPVDRPKLPDKYSATVSDDDLAYYSKEVSRRVLEAQGYMGRDLNCIGGSGGLQNIMQNLNTSIDGLADQMMKSFGVTNKDGEEPTKAVLMRVIQEQSVKRNMPPAVVAEILKTTVDDDIGWKNLQNMFRADTDINENLTFVDDKMDDAFKRIGHQQWATLGAAWDRAMELENLKNSYAQYAQQMQDYNKQAKYINDVMYNRIDDHGILHTDGSEFGFFQDYRLNAQNYLNAVKSLLGETTAIADQSKANQPQSELQKAQQHLSIKQ